MSQANLSNRYTAPPAPPFLVRLDRYKQFWSYELKRNWKSRTTTLIIFLITLTLIWWVYMVKLPYLNQKQLHQLTPDSLETQIIHLKKRLAELKTTASEEKLQTLQQHIVEGYAGISALLEKTIDAATHHNLILAYEMETPTPAHLVHFDDLFRVNIQIILTPLPKSSAQQAWTNIMRQIHTMLEVEQKYKLSTLHISTNNQHINQITMHVSVLVRLDDWSQSL